MSLLLDSRSEEPHSVIGAYTTCNRCGGRMINDEVWGWLHLGKSIDSSTPDEVSLPAPASS